MPLQGIQEGFGHHWASFSAGRGRCTWDLGMSGSVIASGPPGTLSAPDLGVLRASGL